MIKKVSMLLALLTLASSLLNAGLLDFGFNEVQKKIRYSFGAGLNIPYKGYSGYFSNPVFSARLDIVRKKDFQREKLNYRIDSSYFMMMVPEDTYGVTEDMFEVSGSIIYGLANSKKLFPYFGVGLGLYLDWVRINTAALESSYLYRFLGMNCSLGCEWNISSGLVLIPEVKGHGIFVSGFNLSTNLSFLLNIAITPSNPRYMSSRRKK